MRWIFRLWGENLANLNQRREIKLYMYCYTLNGNNFGKILLHCNGIDPFVTLMGSCNGNPFHVTTSFLVRLLQTGWSGGAMVLGKLPVRGVLQFGL